MRHQSQEHRSQKTSVPRHPKQTSVPKAHHHQQTSMPKAHHPQQMSVSKAHHHQQTSMSIAHNLSRRPCRKRITLADVRAESEPHSADVNITSASPSTDVRAKSAPLQQTSMPKAAMEISGARWPPSFWIGPNFLEMGPPWPPSFGHKRHQNATFPQNITKISLAPPALAHLNHLILGKGAEKLQNS